MRFIITAGRVKKRPRRREPRAAELTRAQARRGVMTVYFVATYDIVDRYAYAAYRPALEPLLRKHGVEILVVDAEPVSLEGSPHATVVMRFPSEEAARAFYEDPAYAPVKDIRVKSTRNASVVLAQAFVPAGA